MYRNLSCCCFPPLYISPEQRPVFTSFTNTEAVRSTIYWVGERCGLTVDGIRNVCRKDLVNGGGTVRYSWGVINGLVDPNLWGYIVEPIGEGEYTLLQTFQGENYRSRDMLTHGEIVDLDQINSLFS